MTTMLGTVLGCWRYDRLDDSARAAVRAKRLKRLLDHTRRRSPAYAARWDGLPDHLELSDLPAVTKAELMPDLGHWVTDPHFSEASLRAYLADRDNIGRRLDGRWLVFTTSGSTGDPLVALYDRSATAVLSGVNTARGLARGSALKRLFSAGGRSVGVFAEGFYLSHASVRARVLAMPWKAKQFQVVSALKPMAQIVAALNEAQPALLGGYSTVLELLATEQEAGRLSVRPALVMAGGEGLSVPARERIEAAFGCWTQQSYACTEGGPIAAECEHRRLHVNDDWVIIEPVDHQNRPVPAGTTSDKLLLTPLFNYTQPFVRYEVTDRVALHDDPCPCARRSPWLTVDGRSDDVVELTTTSRAPVKVAPLAVYAALQGVPGVALFQVAVGGNNQVELRLKPEAGADHTQVGEAARRRLGDFLADRGVSAHVRLGPEPTRQRGGGKFRHVIALETRANSKGQAMP